jgi:hypothetical protein
MLELVPIKLIVPASKYKSALEEITLTFKTPDPAIFISLVQMRPFEINVPVVFVVKFQNPVQPGKVGFTDPLSEVETVIEGKAH